MAEQRPREWNDLVMELAQLVLPQAQWDDVTHVDITIEVAMGPAFVEVRFEHPVAEYAETEG